LSPSGESLPERLRDGDIRRGGVAVDDFSDIAVDLAHIDDAHPGFAAK
jgi:hypothetical protein